MTAKDSGKKADSQGTGAPTTRLLKLTQIETNGGTQVRVTIHPGTVADYAERYEAGDKLPPLVIFQDGAHYWLADGFHRYQALKQIGTITSSCDVWQGTLEDARWFAISANKTHGLRLSREDKRNAVEQALKLRPELSDDAIAAHAGASPRTVQTIKQKLRRLGQIAPVGKVVGKDGVVRIPPPPPPRRALPPAPTTPPASRPPTKGADEPTRDAAGRVVPADLLTVWERRHEVEDVKQHVSRARVAIQQAMEDRNQVFAELHFQNVLQWLDNVYRELAATKPYIVCPWCGGLSPTCTRCKKLGGFVSKFQWRTFATPEMKQMVKVTDEESSDNEAGHGHAGH